MSKKKKTSKKAAAGWYENFQATMTKNLTKRGAAGLAKSTMGLAKVVEDKTIYDRSKEKLVQREEINELTEQKNEEMSE